MKKVKAVEMENGFLCEWGFADEGGRVSTRRISDCMRNRTRAKAFAKSKPMYALRRTVNSDLRKEGASATLAAAMLGNSPAVNNASYTFDTAEMAEKRRLLEKVNQRSRKAK